MATKLTSLADILPALESLETGEIDAREARALLRRVLEIGRDDAIASDVFAALRSWTGRMLRTNIAGDDLREWYSLFRAVGAQFRGPLSDWSIRIEVLSQLVYERIGIAETRDVTEVLSRKHARALLGELATSADGRLGRAELLERLGLEQANLTRVSTLLLDAGLMTRVEEGRNVSFELSSAGRSHARTEHAPSVISAQEQSFDAGSWVMTEETAQKPDASIASWIEFDSDLAVNEPSFDEDLLAA